LTWENLTNHGLLKITEDQSLSNRVKRSITSTVKRVISYWSHLGPVFNLYNSIFNNLHNSTQNKFKAALQTVELSNVPKHVVVKNGQIVGEIESWTGNQIMADDLQNSKLDIQNEKIIINFSDSEKIFKAYDTECIVRYLPQFRVVILNSKKELRIFEKDNSKPSRRCLGNCILKSTEQTPDCIHNKISNPYVKEEVDIEIDFDNFKMNNLTNDKLVQELEMKILSSKEEFDDSELTKINSKSKSSLDKNYFFVVLGVISLLAFIFSMLVYCYCRRKSIPNGIRYIGQNGVIFK